MRIEVRIWDTGMDDDVSAEKPKRIAGFMGQGFLSGEAIRVDIHGDRGNARSSLLLFIADAAAEKPSQPRDGPAAITRRLRRKTCRGTA
jgi:hypothetical protein